jgi:pyruvate/2-oxoglutarate dehydrogenase complex dihydrolipoamide acyltransferase (E2) component
VIRAAQALNVWQIAAEILRLSEAARSGKASREELTGATITISSLGPMGRDRLDPGDCSAAGGDYRRQQDRGEAGPDRG